jgi:hypothetical protein
MGLRLRGRCGPGPKRGGVVGVIVSLQEWRRRRRASGEDESGKQASEAARGLGDEVVLRACHEVAAGRSVEVHRLAAAVVLNTGDGSFF